jgi:hypothetical protein
MCAIPHQRMQVSVCDTRVGALVIRTGEAFGLQSFRCSPAAFQLTPRSDRQRRWLHTRREGGGEAKGWTIEGGAWLEKTVDRGVSRRCFRLGRALMAPEKVAKPRQAEHEAEQEQEQEHVKGHQDPHRLK